MKKKIGLALGSGGSRAFVHLGVLSVLAEENIPVSVVTGSSMGAVIGAMYAYHPDADAVRREAVNYFSGSKLFGLNPKPSKNDGLFVRRGAWGWIKKYMRTVGIAHVIAGRRGLFRKNIVHRSIHDLLPDKNIEEAELPFGCVAINLTDGQLTTFTKGPVRKSTCAGTAVGVVYKPYVWEEKDFADAAPVCGIPVHLCRELGADLTIAVDIRTPTPPKAVIQNGFDVISRIEMIQSRTLNDSECASADFWLKPDIGNVFWGDFTDLEPIVELGEEAMRAALPELKRLLDHA